MATQRQESWDFESFPHHDSYSQDYWLRAGRLLHRLVREVAQASGDKQGAGMAADVGANPTQFSEALKDGGCKRFADEWLPRVVMADRENKILRFLCRLKRMEPKPLPVSSPEEKLRRLVARCDAKGAMGRALLVEEFGELEADEILRCAGEGQP